MELEEKISEIVSNVYCRTILPDEAVERILLLLGVVGRSEQFSCPLPDEKCDRHKIDDEEGRWEFCNTCKREWAR